MDPVSRVQGSFGNIRGGTRVFGLQLVLLYIRGKASSMGIRFTGALKKGDLGGRGVTAIPFYMSQVLIENHVKPVNR